MVIARNTSKSYLFKLSIPIFFSNIAIPFAGLVDTGLMGHLSDLKFLAAISIATSVITMIFWSFGFLRMGTVGLISQICPKNYNEIILVFIRNLILASFIGLAIIFFKDPIVYLVKYFFKTSEEIQILINQYISIRILSAPAELVIYVLTGLYLGLQKTFISSLMISIFCFGNVALSFLFVVHFDLEILGVAAGTSIAAYLTIIIFIIFSYYYLKNKLSISLTYKKIFNLKKLY